MLITLALSCGMLQNGLAGQSGPQGGVKLYRYGDLLREHGIELTQPALLNALRNADASVRYLAAMKLAEDKVVDATPAIEQALAVEKVPRDRVNFALALALLEDPSGRVELKHICSDRNFVPEFRLYAVRYMFDVHVEKDEDCLSAAKQAVEAANFGDRISALELLIRFQNLTPEESHQVLQLVAARLEDSEPVVRMAASQSLVGLGNPSAVPYLEAAITREQDDSVRSVFEKDLKQLRTRPTP
ncbi:MAG: HEAT repeat domain-containing protein [Terriglobales bacterium]